MHRRLVAICCSLILFSFATTAFAAPSPNMDTLAKEVMQAVVVVNQPIYIYHWFNANGRSQVWKSTNLDAHDPAGYEHLLNGTHTYYQGLCTEDPQHDPAYCANVDLSKLQGLGDNLGPGLYASTDPVATQSYGGGDGWVLMQIRLPKGFRIANVAGWLSDSKKPSAEALQDLKGMDCGDWHDYSISNLLKVLVRRGRENNGHFDIGKPAQRCTLNIRRFVQDKLKIGGVYYPYEANAIDVCSKDLNWGDQSLSGNQARQGAFLLMDPTGIAREDVLVFNSQTTNAKDARRAITTMFYYLSSNIAGGEATTKEELATVQFYLSNPIPTLAGYTMVRYAGRGCFTYANYQNACGSWYQLTDTNGNTTYAPIAVPPSLVVAPDPAATPSIPKISAQSPPNNLGKLLWSDLDGVDQDPNITDWIAKNLLGCQAGDIFTALPN